MVGDANEGRLRREERRVALSDEAGSLDSFTGTLVVGDVLRLFGADVSIERERERFNRLAFPNAASQSLFQSCKHCRKLGSFRRDLRLQLPMLINSLASTGAFDFGLVYEVIESETYD